MSPKRYPAKVAQQSPSFIGSLVHGLIDGRSNTQWVKAKMRSSAGLWHLNSFIKLKNYFLA
jgi:hypothetical protein